MDGKYAEFKTVFPTAPTNMLTGVPPPTLPARVATSRDCAGVRSSHRWGTFHQNHSAPTGASACLCVGITGANERYVAHALRAPARGSSSAQLVSVVRLGQCKRRHRHRCRQQGARRRIVAHVGNCGHLQPISACHFRHRKQMPLGLAG